MYGGDGQMAASAVALCSDETILPAGGIFMLRKITLPLIAAGFIVVGMFGDSREAADAHPVAITPTGVPSPSPTMTATPTPEALGTPTPLVTPTPLDDPGCPQKPHPPPTRVP